MKYGFLPCFNLTIKPEIKVSRIQTLRMKGISKTFGSLNANNKINMSIKSGDILGLLGENGEGKTALMNIQYGLYQPDSGDIIINDKKVKIRAPRDSIKAGIGMVHQHFMLIQNHSVAENIVIGYEKSPFFFPVKSVCKKLEEFSEKYGLETTPLKKVWQLSAGEQQRVEIVKTLLHGADLLILDEPTSVLTPQEIDELFKILRNMKDKGHSIIFISHKLEEIIKLCDRVVVLRKGEIAGSAKTQDVTKKELAKIMIGRDVIFSFIRNKIPAGKKVLEVKNIIVTGDREENAVKGITFSIHKNEIFGIAGVSGNGQRELVEAITGLRKADKGSILIEGKDITNKSSKSISCCGISHIPEERIKFGTVPNLLIYDNSVLKKHYKKPFSNSVFLSYSNIKSHTQMLIDKFRVSTVSINIPMKNLSGGNIQKLIVGRELAENPVLLVAAHPTYGLDIGATEYIRNLFLSRREGGDAVLLVSEDLEEIFEVCDRIAVIFRGEFMGIVKPEEVKIEEIGLMMTGSLRKPMDIEE